MIVKKILNIIQIVQILLINFAKSFINNLTYLKYMPISQEVKDKIISFLKEFLKDKEISDEIRNKLENLNEENLDEFKDLIAEHKEELNTKIQEKLQGTNVTLDDIKEALNSKAECQV